MSSYRLQYFHRNAASELMGLVYGTYEGRSDSFRPGSISYETGFCPHGGKSIVRPCKPFSWSLTRYHYHYLLVSWSEYKAASEMELVPRRIHEGTLGRHFTRPITLQGP